MSSIFYKGKEYHTDIANTLSEGDGIDIASESNDYKISVDIEYIKEQIPQPELEIYWEDI